MIAPTKFTRRESETLDGKPLTYFDIDQMSWYMQGILEAANRTGVRTARTPSPLLNGVILPMNDQHLLVVGDGLQFCNVYLADSGFLGKDPRTRIWKLFDYAETTQLRDRDSGSLSLRLLLDPPTFTHLFMTEFPSQPFRARQETLAYRFHCNECDRVCLVHQRIDRRNMPETLELHFLTPYNNTKNPLLTLSRNTHLGHWSALALDTLLVAGSDKKEAVRK